MADPISPMTLAQVRRMTCRRIAATLVTAMAESDMDFATIAKRLGLEEATPRSWLYEFIDGKSHAEDFRRMSDFALATGHMLSCSVKPVRIVAEDQEQQRAAA